MQSKMNSGEVYGTLPKNNYILWDQGILMVDVQFEEENDCSRNALF